MAQQGDSLIYRLCCRLYLGRSGNSEVECFTSRPGDFMACYFFYVVRLLRANNEVCRSLEAPINFLAERCDCTVECSTVLSIRTRGSIDQIFDFHLLIDYIFSMSNSRTRRNERSYLNSTKLTFFFFLLQDETVRDAPIIALCK